MFAGKCTRRDFLKGVAWGAAGYFAIGNVWDRIGRGLGPKELYAEELMDVSRLTKGQVKVGDVINKDNVHLVKHLLADAHYVEIKELGREIKIGPTTTDINQILTPEWTAATERNRGVAALKDGQLWTKDGKRWIGGYPFPAPKSGVEWMWNSYFMRGVDDMVFECDWYAWRGDSLERHYQNRLFILYYTGRIFNDPKPYLPDYTNMLNASTFVNQEPFDIAGVTILNEVAYDARAMPKAMAYIPALKRVRRLPVNQRFEPLLPQVDIYLSDVSYINDPVLLWEWHVEKPRTLLMPSFMNYGSFPAVHSPADAWNWPHQTKQRFSRVTFELRPQVVPVWGTTKLEGNPYGRKVLFFDPVGLRPLSGEAYDKQGKLWKSFIVAFGPWPGAKNGGSSSVPAGENGVSFTDLQLNHTTHVILPVSACNMGLKPNDWFTQGGLLAQARR